MTRAAVRHELVVWQWNANGLRGKKASLQQYIGQAGRRPYVILLQETHSEAPPSMPGYRTHASPSSARTVWKGAGQGVCILVKKGLTYVEHELLSNSAIEHWAIEVVTGRKKESVFAINVYSNPKQYQQKNFGL